MRIISPEEHVKTGRYVRPAARATLQIAAAVRDAYGARPRAVEPIAHPIVACPHAGKSACRLRTRPFSLAMTLGVLLVLAVSGGVAAAAAQPVALRREVAALVAPVLKAYAAVSIHDNDESQRALESRLNPVLSSHRTEATEALAVLLGLYIGEASAEEISCELVARGDASLPFLELYSGETVMVPGIDTTHVRRINTLYSTVEARIKAGERCEWEK